MNFVSAHENLMFFVYIYVPIRFSLVTDIKIISMLEYNFLYCFIFCHLG